MQLSQSIILILCSLLISCSTTSEEINNSSQALNNNTWAVPLSDLLGNFNPFPEATNPTLTPISEVNNINDDSIVAIVSFDNEVKIYPLSKIHEYETVNDQINNNLYTVSFCPITQSTINFNRIHKDKTLTFRASGFLYKENLVMLDTNTDSYWSQMLLQSIKGPYTYQDIETYTLVETTWKTAKNYFNTALVFTENSIQSSKNAKQYFSTKPTNESIQNNEKVFGVINKLNGKNTSASIYRYSDFRDKIKLYNNTSNTKTVIVGSEKLKFITAFLNEENYTFDTVQNEFPIIFKDSNGNKWDVFGKAISGPNKGEYLKPC